MPRIAPLDLDEVPDDLKSVMQYAESTMGFMANDVLTMARWPELLQVMGGLVGVTFSPASIDMPLKHMVGFISSMSAGCQYCAAHNAVAFPVDGIDPAKRDAIWEYETSPLFTAAERAALNFARAAGQTPNALTDTEFKELQAHFDTRQIMELAGVVCLFGFLNRWNSTFSTALEGKPREWAETHLAPHGWKIGPHE
jgi:uncharacterized peroxidase-related enzyme